MIERFRTKTELSITDNLEALAIATEKEHIAQLKTEIADGIRTLYDHGLRTVGDFYV